MYYQKKKSHKFFVEQNPRIVLFSLKNVSFFRKSQEPYDLLHMWNIKQKATNEQGQKTNRNSETQTKDWQLPEGKGVWEEAEEDQGGQIYDDGRRLDFGW